jgi:ElaB/YqjD/DUF883 family membrane-anchored ribosome-binding protein
MTIESNTPDNSGNGHSFGVTAPAPKAMAATASAAVSGELRSLLADVQDLIQQTTSFTREDLANAKEKIAERVATAKQSVATLGTSIAASTKRQAAMADRYVHDEPWTMIGVGAGVGFALGFLLARR